MLQQSGLLREYWYVAARAEDITAKKPFAATILEVPLVLWRGADGKATALLDRCAHRNAPLSEGRIVDQCVVCPYHGWAYNGSGACADIPSETAGTINAVGKAVPPFPVVERYGLVWVWMGVGVPDKEPFEMPYFSGEGWHNYYMVTDFENNVTELAENFMDVPHTVFVHEGWFRERRKIGVKALVERTPNSVLVTYDQPKDSIGFTGKLLNPKGLPMVHTDKFYMPNVTRVDYAFGENERAFIITSTCTPIRPFFTRVYTLITYKFGWLNPLAHFFMPPYTKKVINQDVWIMRVAGATVQKFGGTEYRSTQADTLHVFIEQLRENAEKGNTQTLKPIETNIEFWI
jgi:phenylpropionate dioxygenase-like ring-hydroxylating dioxygenase large terminal subunit